MIGLAVYFLEMTYYFANMYSTYSTIVLWRWLHCHDGSKGVRKTFNRVWEEPIKRPSQHYASATTHPSCNFLSFLPTLKLASPPRTPWSKTPNSLMVRFWSCLIRLGSFHCLGSSISVVSFLPTTCFQFGPFCSPSLFRLQRRLVPAWAWG